MAWVADTCPVTEEAAERRLEEADGYREYRCPFCHKFRISQASLPALARYPVDRRIELLALAREVAGDDEVPLIDNVP
jgi:hypothetical protein